MMHSCRLAKAERERLKGLDDEKKEKKEKKSKYVE